jgi:hypothetical protein
MSFLHGQSSTALAKVAEPPPKLGLIRSFSGASAAFFRLAHPLL